MTADSMVIIGADPSGLAGARNLDRQGVARVGFQPADDVGGLWDIDGLRDRFRFGIEMVRFEPADDDDEHRHRRHLVQDRPRHPAR